MSQSLPNKIQKSIEAEARVWGEESFYRPSLGQTWSHVAHRITMAVITALEEER